MDTHAGLIAVPILILLNAFFVASEYAVVAARPVHLEALRGRGRRAPADAMARLKASPASAIGAIQVCITVTNLALGWLGEPAMTALLMAIFGPAAEAVPEAVFRPISVGLAFLIVTLLTVVFSELLPKALTMRYVAPAVTLTAVPIRWISAAVWPLVWLMNGMANLVTRPLGLGRVEAMEDEEVSVDELRLLVTEAAREGLLTPNERALIVNTLALNHRPVNRIMVPRTDVRFLDLQRSMEQNREVLGRQLHSRLPLCNGGLDQVIGVVHVKRFLAAYHAEGDVSVLQLVADEPLFVPELSTIGQVLSQLYEHRVDFAVLVDEYGGVSGIVTLRDVVDELMGAVDESKALLTEATRADLKPGLVGPRVVRGDLPVHELARLLTLPDWAKDEAAATVAGLVQSRLGHIGEQGEEVRVDGVALRVLKSDRRAIRRVEVRMSSPAG